MMEKSEFNRSWLPELKDYAKSHSIELLASPFDYEAVDLMHENKIAAFKWASGEIVDLDLLEYAAKKRRPMIISTGMSGIPEINDAVNAVKKAKNDKICLLHCTSLYPTPAEHANLRMMESMKNVFDYPIGFSDHTLGINIALAAVARGAAVVEKHITLDKKLDSPDHSYSLKPNEFKALVSGIREIEKSFGKKEKNMIPEEKGVAQIARRSLIAVTDIAVNTILTDKLITVKRPGTGILPKYKSLVMGRRTKRNIQQDEILALSDLK
jgi:N-acetylneuraminate synthase/N,N'-diacetyllegionaminate synthase